MLWPTCLLSAYKPTKTGWMDETGVLEGQGDAVPHRYPSMIPKEVEKLQLAACASPLLFWMLPLREASGRTGEMGM